MIATSASILQVSVQQTLFWGEVFYRSCRSSSMVYYVVYRASRIHSNRSLIPARLRAIGCRQINRTFWEFEGGKISRVMKVVDKNRPIVLKRAREVERRAIIEGGIQALGSVIVVSFEAPKDEKEKIRNLVKRAPCIRLCKRVYVFYQLHSRFDPNGKLLDAERLAAFIKALGGEVKLFPKVVIIDQRSVQRLVDETGECMEKEIFGLLQNCVQLHDRFIKNGSNREQLNRALGKVRGRYLAAKRKAMYYKKWTGLDLSRNLMKAYAAVKRISALPQVASR